MTISSSSIVANHSNSNNLSGGRGGGIYEDDALIQMRNSVLAGNLAEGLGRGNDCFGDVTSLGNNLIQDSDHCNFFAHPDDSDFINETASLAPVTAVAGAVVGSTFAALELMSVRAPLAGSVLLDQGNANGCFDAAGVLLATDQLGRSRSLDGTDPDTTARCDIGAVEFAP